MSRGKSLSRVLAAIEAEPWLITDEGYERIVAIASRSGGMSPEAISAMALERSAESSLVSMYGDTAVVEARGPFFRYANLFSSISGATSTEQFTAELARVDRDPAVSRIIVRYDTPGGAASGAAEASDLIRNLQTPSVGFVSGMACSLGYFFASQHPTIVAAADSIVGNIGTRARAPSARDPGELTSRGAPRKILSKDDVQSVLDALEAVFIEHVARGRGVDEEYVRTNYGQGGVFVGAAALSAGLVDAIGTLDSILGGTSTAVKPPAPLGAIISSPQQRGPQMADENESGGLTAAEHTAALAAVETQARAAQEAAVKAATDRCVAIFEASAGKPLAAVLPIVRNPAITAEQAIQIISAFPDAAQSGVSERYSAGNPQVANDDPVADDPEDESQAAIDASWGNAIKRVV